MKQQNTKLSFKGQDVYVGLDTGKKSWTVTILTEHLEQNTLNTKPLTSIQFLKHWSVTYTKTFQMPITFVLMKLGSLASGFMMH